MTFATPRSSCLRDGESHASRGLVRWLRKGFAAGALCALAFASGTAEGHNRYLESPPETDAYNAPAYVYANMSNRDAFAELDRRKVAYIRLDTSVRGVRAPIRLSGPIRGVAIHSTLPESQWDTTIFNILDARLALALDDLCRTLAQHDVVELLHFTMYRTPGKPEDRFGFRHPGGLAIDLGAVKKSNGEWLSVGPHWPSEIGAKTCGDGARKLLGRRGRELMSILCEVADQRIFHYMLSPHFDEPHSDHFHLEIKPGVKWFLVN
jgi:hypothetical protein